MKITRRTALLGLAAASLARPALARSAHADGANWPERPIRLIVPVAPGGSQDIVARHSAHALSQALGQPVQVENLPGGGSNIGYDAAARARPDGYTWLAGSDTLSITGSLTPHLPYDPLAFAPIHRTVRVPQILVVAANSPHADLASFVAAARENAPAVGTPGSGSLAHLLLELAQQASESTWIHVAYRGGALALNDLMAGHLQGVMINIGAVTEHVREGRLRGLAVSSEGRTLALPEVPTLTEQGFAGLTALGWHGLVAPAGTDPAILARVNAASRAAVKEPELAARLQALGVEPTDETPEVLAEVIRADAERWGAVVRRVGIVAG